MKITLNTNQIAVHLYEDKNAAWSWEGAHALASYLEEMESATGEEMELDVVAIRCDFTEYESALEAAEANGYEKDEEQDEKEQEENALEWLKIDFTVIEFNGGVIVQNC